MRRKRGARAHTLRARRRQRRVLPESVATPSRPLMAVPFCMPGCVIVGPPIIGACCSLLLVVWMRRLVLSVCQRSCPFGDIRIRERCNSGGTLRQRRTNGKTLSCSVDWRCGAAVGGTLFASHLDFLEDACCHRWRSAGYGFGGSSKRPGVAGAHVPRGPTGGECANRGPGAVLPSGTRSF